MIPKYPDITVALTGQDGNACRASTTLSAGDNHLGRF
jgi:hypothetical protein